MSDVYSLWVIPDRESEAYRRFDEIIRDLAAAWEDAPEFEPHVTLLGGILTDHETVLTTTETLIQDQQPLELTFSGVRCSTTRYQCIFALVEPTVELLSLHQTAVHKFDVPAEMYLPHLSLVYSDMSIDDRISTARSIDTAELPTTVQGDTVAVVETTGPVSEWDTVATYQL